MLTDFQNSFTIDTREKNAVTLCRWQRCPPKTFTYHYVVIQNMQFIQRMASSSLTQWLSAVMHFKWTGGIPTSPQSTYRVVVGASVPSGNVCRPNVKSTFELSSVSCNAVLCHSLIAVSITRWSRLSYTLTAPHALPQLFHVLDLILLNAVLQNSPPHSRWALDMDRLLDGHRECWINFRRLRLPVPCLAEKWSTHNIWVTFHKVV